MKRYQVYLNPQSVSIIDEAKKYTDISRSAVIRMMIDSVAYNLTRVFTEKTSKPKSYPYLDSLMGTIEIKGKQQVNFSKKNDIDYYKD